MSWIPAGLSLRCLCASDSKSRKWLEILALLRRSRVSGVVFVNFPKVGKEPHQDLNLGLFPSDVCRFTLRDQ